MRELKTIRSSVAYRNGGLNVGVQRTEGVHIPAQREDPRFAVLLNFHHVDQRSHVLRHAAFGL